VWFVLLAAAFANGLLREALLRPRFGDPAARAMSSLILAAAIIAIAGATIRWLHPSSRTDAWQIGGLWVTWTVAFEFLVGHYVFGTPWPALLADYNLLAGRIWILVLLATLAAPFAAGLARGMFERPRNMS
jgi:hypothetical protein